MPDILQKEKTLAPWNDFYSRSIFCPLEKIALFCLPKRTHKKILSVIRSNLQHRSHDGAFAMVAEWEGQICPLQGENRRIVKFRCRLEMCTG